MKTFLILVALLFVACSTGEKRNAAQTSKLSVHSIADFQSAGEFEFLSSTVDQKNVVQLAESIHMTHEQPLARLGLIRFLNQKKNFDVLAFEGSTLDFWVAMEAFLSSKKQDQDITAFRKKAFFGLWQTKEMEEVLRAALETLPTEKPLYVTSFDIQPGIGFGFRKINPFFELGRSLQTYLPSLKSRDVVSVIEPLYALQGCAQNGFPKSVAAKDSALKSISTLKGWIAKAQPKVKQKYPKLPHAEALSLVPDSLQKTVELCEAHQKNTDTENKWAAYQPKRDELNAELTKQIETQVSRNHKLITWAHHSHANYNTLARVRTTLGQALKDHFGSKLFTIGVFAREGSALIAEEEPELKDLCPLQDSELDTYLSSLSQQSYYVDLGTPEAKAIDILNRPATIRIEGIGLWKAQLAKDYDAIIYLDRVSPPKVDFSPLK